MLLGGDLCFLVFTFILLFSGIGRGVVPPFLLAFDQHQDIVGPKFQNATRSAMFPIEGESPLAVDLSCPRSSAVFGALDSTATL